ncbi:hypothetical protein QTG54_006021, partial [Skeletonema marinoi]
RQFHLVELLQATDHRTNEPHARLFATILPLLFNTLTKSSLIYTQFQNEELPNPRPRCHRCMRFRLRPCLTDCPPRCQAFGCPPQGERGLPPQGQQRRRRCCLRHCHGSFRCPGR